MNPSTRASALLLASGLAACGGSSSGGPPEGAPNVVLVSIDSLRADHLGCYGHGFPTSPTIDALAADGARFEEAVSTTSWTLPAHAALFTGLYDTAHGLVDNGQRLAEEHSTLAEAFQAAGWQTAGFFGGPYLHPTFGLAQGFDVYQSCMTTLPDELEDEAVRDESRARKGRSHEDITGPRTLEEVERWSASAGDEPFFLFVHLWDVHYDFIAPPKYVELFDPGYTGRLTGVDFMGNNKIHKRMPPRELQHLKALYDAEIRYTDEILGKILTALERDGRMENTIVVVTADHGEEFLEHAGKGHQRTLYDEVLRVPLIFHWNGRFKDEDGRGRSIPQQVRLIDVMPTLLTLAGVERQPRVIGQDLTPLLLGEAAPETPALCELLVDQRVARVLRTREFKTIRLGSGAEERVSGFDLASDPRELAPLRAKERATQQGLEVLERELQRAQSFRVGTSNEVDVDPEVLERLRNLGYIGDDGSR